MAAIFRRKYRGGWRMDSQIKRMAKENNSAHMNRRLFIERFIVAFGLSPLSFRLLESSGLAAAPAQSASSASIDSADVKYPGDDATLQGYLSRPKGKGPFSGVIIVHKNLGLEEQFRDVSRRLASQGYAALAVDLLSRQGGTSAFTTPQDAEKAYQNVKDIGALSDLDSAYRYMDSNSTVKKDDIAIMGFAPGGQKSFLYATTNPKLKAVVIYYGSAPPDDKLAQIPCPVLELVGDKDKRFAPAVPVIQEKMSKLGKTYESKIYPEADHDFFDTASPNYNEAAAKESWTVVLDIP
jgi:carboxymethylenebutenolidase